MKTKNIFPLLLGASMACALTACIDDDSTYGGNPIPDLSVTTTETDPDKLPEVNFNYGDECVITPQINYSGTAPLSYEWSVGTLNNGVKGELEFVSNEPVFRHSFKSGGSYYAHLNVTDGTVGIVQEYQVNVNRTFEQGYIIVSSDRDGYGNLSFIKDLTAEDREQGITSIVLEHCVERVNEGVKKENIAGVTILRLSWPTTLTRVVASYGSASYFLDPNTFTSISTIDHEKVIPGFNGTEIIGGTDAIVRDAATNRYITLLGSDMLGVEKSDNQYQGHGYDLTSFYSYYQWGIQNYEYYHANRSPLSVSIVATYGYTNTDDLTYEDAPLFDGHQYINLFVGESAQYEVYYEEWGWYPVSYYPGYVLSKCDGKYYFTHLRKETPYQAAPSIIVMGRSEIATDANTAIPDTDCAIAVSSTYHRIYYTCDNRVYVMLIDGDTVNWPARSRYALSFPSNEEITYMTIDTNTDQLIVATADKSTGRGSVYFYNAADVRTDSPNAEATAHYADCADRISYIIYKPRVAN